MAVHRRPARTGAFDRQAPARPVYTGAEALNEYLRERFSVSTAGSQPSFSKRNSTASRRETSMKAGVTPTGVSLMYNCAPGGSDMTATRCVAPLMTVAHADEHAQATKRMPVTPYDASREVESRSPAGFSYMSKTSSLQSMCRRRQTARKGASGVGVDGAPRRRGPRASSISAVPRTGGTSRLSTVGSSRLHSRASFGLVHFRWGKCDAMPSEMTGNRRKKAVYVSCRPDNSKSKTTPPCTLTAPA